MFSYLLYIAAASALESMFTLALSFMVTLSVASIAEPPEVLVILRLSVSCCTDISVLARTAVPFWFTVISSAASPVRITEDYLVSVFSLTGPR